MIYGLYLSATGVLANSYRQDVIANNLANAETVGFKRSLALFQERRTEAQQHAKPGETNPMLENIGGGTLASPTFIDRSQGQLEQTGNNLDAAIRGKGFFTVQSSGPNGQELHLTRNGQFMINRAGDLVLGDGSGERVLDAQRKPIQLRGVLASKLLIQQDGTISAGGEPLAKLGVFNVTDESKLLAKGGTLLGYAGDIKSLPADRDASVDSGFIESSNVDPMTELTHLMAAQRQLEANANMIRSQDQTLGKLVNEVGKIG